MVTGSSKGGFLTKKQGFTRPFHNPGQSEMNGNWLVREITNYQEARGEKILG